MSPASRSSRPAPPRWGRSGAEVAIPAAVLVLTAAVASVFAAETPAPPPRERCLPCHEPLARGLGAAHDPARIGCVACHLGDRTTDDKLAAHAGMIRWPGSDLSTTVAPCANCHAEAFARVLGSLMTTNGGLVAVNRFVFGEAPTPDGGATARIDALDPARAADRHAAELCSTCHLGAAKESAGLAEPSERRGGGCLACHLRGRAGDAHPAVDLAIPDDACFGCHSRSGRISLSYAGWTELDASRAAAPPAPGRARRVLPDGRVLEAVEPDVHHAAGLGCVDCHGVEDVMGDLVSHAHARDAVRSRCVDCHVDTADGRAPAARARNLASLDRAGQVIARSRWGSAASSRSYLAGAERGVLVNARRTDEGAVEVTAKRTGKVARAKPTPRAAPHDSAHRRLACDACHTQASPRCLGCHTSAVRDPSGVESWRERGWSFDMDAPTLGVDARGKVTPFVPGMILTLERDGARLERRLFAPLAAHSTGARARSCASCHRSAEALGVGEGELAWRGLAVWFTPREPLAADGLPRDAWTGFLAPPPAPPLSTRTGARPFDAAEQARILRVGGCLACHDGASTIYADFEAAVSRRPAACTASPSAR